MFLLQSILHSKCKCAIRLSMTASLMLCSHLLGPWRSTRHHFSFGVVSARVNHVFLDVLFQMHVRPVSLTMISIQIFDNFLIEKWFCFQGEKWYLGCSSSSLILYIFFAYVFALHAIYQFLFKIKSFYSSVCFNKSWSFFRISNSFPLFCLEHILLLAPF